MSFAIFHDTKTYYKLVILIVSLLFFDKTYSLEQCSVDKKIIENEKMFSHIVWSPNSIYDDSSNGTILVNELTTLIFTCKSNAYRFVSNPSLKIRTANAIFWNYSQTWL